MINLFSDPTNGYIQNRIGITLFSIINKHTGLTDSEKRCFLKYLIVCEKKMACVWRHFKNYTDYENNYIIKFQECNIVNGFSDVEYSNELFCDFDVFLVQIKSTLDCVSKIPKCLLGNEWTIRTFANKGKKSLMH